MKGEMKKACSAYVELAEKLLAYPSAKAIVQQFKDGFAEPLIRNRRITLRLWARPVEHEVGHKC